eukprot:TRINITY_DN6138_c0_g1_i1.p1 TRINITY_DN6138_c0_g1~~TRINITY_DN6138_c0_g1_i1.p1  ORF type:complete len:143 (-),score=3.52 TRINITY_DN6138_c0_g1_i1:96-524(-)
MCIRDSINAEYGTRLQKLEALHKAVRGEQFQWNSVSEKELRVLVRKLDLIPSSFGVFEHFRCMSPIGDQERSEMSVQSLDRIHDILTGKKIDRTPDHKFIFQCSRCLRFTICSNTEELPWVAKWDSCCPLCSGRWRQIQWHS